MNTNPAGNTIISNARETTAEANGEFEHFEVIGLAEVQKTGVAEQTETAVPKQ